MVQAHKGQYVSASVDRSRFSGATNASELSAGECRTQLVSIYDMDTAVHSLIKCIIVNCVALCKDICKEVECYSVSEERWASVISASDEACSVLSSPILSQRKLICSLLQKFPPFPHQPLSPNSRRNAPLTFLRSHHQRSHLARNDHDRALTRTGF